MLYEGNPHLISTHANIFKLWWSCGWVAGGLCYAESTDGSKWVHYKNDTPIIGGVLHGFVLHSGSTYYYYGANIPGGYRAWDQYTSTDGIHWTLAHASVLTVGDRPWDLLAGNIDVFRDGSTWYALFEAADSQRVWRVGLATSPDGISWTKDPSNPVIQNRQGGMCGGPEAHRVNGAWYAWLQCTPSGPPNDFPSDIYRFHSTDLRHWVLDTQSPALARETSDEGAGNDLGQVADPSLVEVNGMTYLFYDATATQDPGPGGGIHLKYAIARMPMKVLVTTQEGSGGSY